MANRRQKLFLTLLLAGGCPALLASSTRVQFYGKTYQRWTAAEAQRVITDSPWARTQAGLVSSSRIDQPSTASDTAVTVRLYSALPVRQALARINQLKAGYDKRSDSERVAIDAKNKSMLECPDCADHYVVVMSPGPGSVNGIPTNLQYISLDRLKLSVHITNENGETRELVKFVRPKFFEDEAVFFFSRFNSKREPLIGPANHTLTISFDLSIFASNPPRLARFEFDVAKMIVNGQVVS